MPEPQSEKVITVVDDPSMKSKIDIVCQVAISVLGITALILVTEKNRWGFVVGLAGQPFWYIATYRSKQWGIFILCIAYTLTWAWGVYKWF